MLSVPAATAVTGDAVRLRLPWRPAAAVVLGVAEILVTSFLFSFSARVEAWQHPSVWLRHIELLVIVSTTVAIVLLLLRVARRRGDFLASAP